ncbi:MAG: Stk1 family PASTA domain-containing Ser/Thr kinase, partial [Clostridiales bacterium]|nr:Stk1 family PASTA domain-containing Ser/Thr kinase [Clostridiales bacterium]
MDERILDNKYIINQIIGTGGMSIVYSGFSMDTGEEVAIKVLRPEYKEDDEFVRRFRKESKIAQQLTHKNIIRTMDTGEDDGLPYIVMEYIKGKTLKELIHDRIILTNDEAISVGIKISDALFYAHSHKLIHRDIKPQNVLLRPDGTLKVADFGIARIQDSGTITLSGSNVLGSVHYISPEQARGVNTTEKADIYSLGIVLYEMVTGAVPFDGDTPVSVAIKHLQEDAISPRLKNPQVSIGLEDIILKAISKAPEVRYDNAFEMAQDLKKALEHPEGGFVKKKIATGDTLVNIPKITQEMEMMALKARQQNNGIHQPPKNATSVKSYNRSRRKRSATYSIFRLMITLVVIVGMMVTLFLVGQSLLSNTGNKPMHEVPRVMGQNEETAENMIREMGFIAEAIYEYHALVTNSVVISQDPQTGEILQEGSVVSITVSLGKQVFSVPDVLNRDYAEAAHLIEQAGLVVGDVTKEFSEMPLDYVLGQSPGAGEEIAEGDSVHLTIAKAVDDTVQKMPSVLNLLSNSAQANILDIGYEIFQIIELNGNENKGTVIKQEPEEGAMLNSDTKIILWISNGEGAVYTKAHIVLLSIETDDTHIVIEFVDEGV